MVHALLSGGVFLPLSLINFALEAGFELETHRLELSVVPLSHLISIEFIFLICYRQDTSNLIARCGEWDTQTEREPLPFQDRKVIRKTNCIDSG